MLYRITEKENDKMKVRNAKKLLALVMALILALALCACGESKTETAKEAIPTPTPAPAATAAPAAPAATEAPKAAETKAATDSPVGVYEITKSVSDGKEEDLAALKEMGIAMYLVLEEDGTAYLDLFGERTPLKWTDKEFLDDEGSSIAYTYANDVITMIADDGTMTCERLVGDALKAYEENGSGSLDNLISGIGSQLGEQLSGLGDQLGEQLGGLGGLGDWDWNDEPVESDIPDGEPSVGPVSGVIGDYEITILGAEAVLDVDDEPAIIFWYEFTNLSDEPNSAGMALDLSTGQDGWQLFMTFQTEDHPEEYNAYMMVAPDHTIRCFETYKYNPDGGVVAFQIEDFWSEETVTYYADPKNPTGAPTEPFVIPVDGNIPDIMYEIESTDGNFEVTGIEIIEDIDGNDAIRIFIDYTNNTDEESSLFMAYDIYPMQDGIQLSGVLPAEDIEEDENSYTDIKPGETITCAKVYELRSDSPISVILDAGWGEYYGDIFNKD